MKVLALFGHFYLLYYLYLYDDIHLQRKDLDWQNLNYVEALDYLQQWMENSTKVQTFVDGANDACVFYFLEAFGMQTLRSLLICTAMERWQQRHIVRISSFKQLLIMMVQ